MRRHLAWIAAGVLTAGVLLGACAQEETVEPVATDQINLPPSYKFEPEAITVPDGTTVTWTNNDHFSHNVRLLDDGGDLLPLAPGESVSFTFTGPGTHHYDCSLHPNDMHGVVIVTES